MRKLWYIRVLLYVETHKHVMISRNPTIFLLLIIDETAIPLQVGGSFGVEFMFVDKKRLAGTWYPRLRIALLAWLSCALIGLYCMQHSVNRNAVSVTADDTAAFFTGGHSSTPVPPFSGVAASLRSSKQRTFRRNPMCTALLANTTKLYAQWNLARAELQLKKPNISHIAKARALDDFYSTSFGALTVTIGGGPITYVMIWKCANDAIRKNLLRNDETVVSGSATSMSFRKKKESHTTAELALKLYLQYGVTRAPPTFTFAREPLSRFSSGMAEYYWRNFQRDMISVDQLEKDILRLLDMTPFPGPEYVTKHFMAMSGILTVDFGVRLIGRLENFEEDWRNISSTLRMNFSFNRSLGWHESSADPNGVKAAFEELYRRDVRYLKAMCQIFFVDFVCFEYEVPLECKHIKTSLDLPDDSEIFVDYTQQ